MEYKVIEGLYYTRSDEWVKVEGNVATIGITDYAQDKLGDIVYVEQAEVGKALKREDRVLSVESVKAASDIYTPLSGEVIEVNTLAVQNPSIINSDPYGEGWLFKIRFSDSQELSDLIDAEAYKEYRNE